MRQSFPRATTIGRLAGQTVVIPHAAVLRYTLGGLLALALVGVEPAAPQTGPSPPVAGSAELQIAVTDENDVAVAGAVVTLTPAASMIGPAPSGVTDFAGRIKFSGLTPGVYSLKVEKEGFYAITQDQIDVGVTSNAEVTLNHVREFSEHVSVVYSPPAIDPAKTQASDSLSNANIINLPFTVARDIRYALPLLPGVLQDCAGQLHVNGASTRQVNDQMDGFDISDPATGQFLSRVSVDALRSVNVASSRYSTQYGKGSGGMITLLTGMGDDHWRWTATDFIPTFQTRRGINLNNWTPRGMVSGPLRKGRAWFMDALEGEYDLAIFTELPVGADRYSVLRGSNLSKIQINLASNNNLTAGLLVNYLHSPHSGLDPLDPISTTLDDTNHALLFTVKDQHLFHNGSLLEGGLAVGRYYSHSVPMGAQPYVITPNGTLGNYYSSNHGRGSRTEGIGNLFVRPLYAAGKHEFKLGFDAGQVSDQQTFNRMPYRVEREDGTLSRRVTFANAPPFTRDNVEVSSYLEDRWSVTNRWLVEPGTLSIRLGPDHPRRGAFPSPRFHLPCPSEWQHQGFLGHRHLPRPE